MPTPTPTNYATSPMPTIATSPPIDTPHVCHVTTAAPPLIEGCGRMTSATSRLSAAATNAHSVPRHQEEHPPLNAMSRSPRRREGRWERGGRRTEKGKGDQGGKGSCGGTGRRAGGSTCCPRFFSFRTGQRVLPRFFSFRTGQRMLPRFFAFQTGAAYAEIGRAHV